MTANKAQQQLKTVFDGVSIHSDMYTSKVSNRKGAVSQTGLAHSVGTLLSPETSNTACDDEYQTESTDRIGFVGSRLAGDF